MASQWRTARLIAAVTGSLPTSPPGRSVPARGEVVLRKCAHSGPCLSSVVKVAAGGDGPVTDFEPRSVTTPLATYRVQFGPEFTFDDAANIAGYLSRLGVSHL